MFKKITLFGISLLLASSTFFAVPTLVSAQGTTQTGGVKDLQENLGSFGGDTGLGSDEAGATNDDLYGRIAALINIVLGFLGIIAVILIIAAGFKWMTAGGNEEEVKKARDNIKNAVIGLAIVLGSYVIVNFAVSQVSRAVREGSEPNPTQRQSGVVPPS